MVLLYNIHYPGGSNPEKCDRVFARLGLIFRFDLQLKSCGNNFMNSKPQPEPHPSRQSGTNTIPMTRRTFVKTTATFAGMTALSASRVVGANERIGVGVIGFG